jgi:hypothetical protein
MDLGKQKITLLRIDAQLNLVQTLLIAILCIDNLFASENWIKIKAKKTSDSERASCVLLLNIRQPIKSMETRAAKSLHLFASTTN